MATKFLNEAQRGASRGSIDFPLALLAGLSVGFVAFVMPADLLSRAVELSQLPSILSAAEPPLGNKARAALAAIAAGGTILAVFLLLRMLGRKAEAPRRREREAAEPEREFEAPRLRRSDVHPDAPARRPILAARELGEPTPSRAPFPAPAPAPAPFWRPEDFPAEPQAEQADDGPADELELDGPGIEMLAPAPPPVDPTAAPTLPEPVLVPAAALEAAAAPPTAETAGDDSIAELMARLERGLARRRQERHETAFVPPTAEPAVFVEPERGDDRLRSAIENLQKMAARAR
ncbi:MAG TPA: hypothetical protein VGB08_07650 [Allosphingosinicella sp.]|jgi:hypothetical protein